MNRISTNFLRAALLGMGLAVIGLCILVLPAIHREWNAEFPGLEYLRYPVMIVLGTTVIPFFTALYNAMKLLGFIDKNKAFTAQSIHALRNIKYCATAISVIFVTGLPVIYHIAEEDDAPGLILIFSAIFIGIPIVISVFTGVVQKLLQNAIDIKSENDLTV